LNNLVTYRVTLPQIAHVVVVAPDEILINGKAVGSTISCGLVRGEDQSSGEQ